MAAGGAAELNEASLQTRLKRHLAGPHPEAPAVTWVLHGDEVVLHLDSLAVRIEPGAVHVSVPLETDQTGPATQEVVVALAAAGDEPDLLAVTDELPRGHEGLAARWGPALQEGVWQALLAAADERAGGRANGIAAGEHVLVVHGPDGG